jgi:3-phenylpropionate/trans-cinnamate dioxygenase ferredoxin reductase subunit
VSKPVQSIAVVGAGLAGLRACEGLRARGFEGTIVLIGQETHVPYDRPPLSKQFLAGTWDLDRVVLRSSDKLAELNLDLRLGPDCRAVGLDSATKTVTLASGVSVVADGIVLATGAAARRLPGINELPGVFVLRTLDDSAGLKSVLVPGARLGLVGAGFIGLEVAATARKLGVEVTVVEPLDVPLGRTLGPVGGGACQRMHAEEGVTFRLKTTVESAKASSQVGGGLKCHLSDDTDLDVDTLLVGIGATPSVDWLDGSGLEVGPGGVTVDKDLLAAPGIAVAGDLARWLMPGPGGTSAPVRVEHRTNAAEQGEWAAAGLLRSLGLSSGDQGEGELTRSYEVPYVWSDQYNVKIQILGMPGPDDDVFVVEANPDERRLVALHGRDGLLTGCVGVSRPRQVMSLRPLIERHATMDEAKALF